MDTIQLAEYGYTKYPALVNAHDHLELNHYPRIKFRERYENAYQWGEEVNSQLNKSPIRELRAYPLEDKLFIGGLKNLLCGALTVVHHNPPHKALFKHDFPVRVVRKYGWAHSLHFAPQAEITESYRATPRGASWFIHLAEGVDDVAAAEYQTLKSLGCVSEKSVFVHAVGMSYADWDDARQFHPNGVPFVWCPTTNNYLFGVTIGYRALARERPFLGSDSRLTADGDLLDEIRFAYDYLPEEWKRNAASPDALISKYLAKPDTFRGETRPDDWFALKTGDQLVNSRRGDIALIVRGGEPQIGNSDLMAKFPKIKTVEAILDGKPKLINARLAGQISRCSLKESGLELFV